MIETQIHSISGSDYLVLYGVLLVFLGCLIFYAYQAFKRFRYIDGTATSKVRSAAQGHVELKGLGEWLPNDTILSPFSKSRCIWYHCTIDKKKRSGKRASWTNISSQCSEHLFRLIDDTGECVVDPDHAHVIPESDVTWYGSNQSDYLNPPGRQRWIRRVGFANYRFREKLIRTATPVYALGWFKTVHSTPSDEHIAKQVDDLVKHWKIQPERYLRQFDLNKNNKLDGDEWKVVRAAARKQVLARMNEEHRAHHLLCWPQNRRQPFILSALDEEVLVKWKKWFAYGSAIVAFLIFSTLVSLYAVRAPLPL